ncbi:DHCW motif cupin fold protein [Bosea sp. BH3]|uniref:DHCW motif cupin fold protein n=1 Tax=Bosea sp. BH3 TaxID=2871701 RepID=UPI0021CB6EEA|nr:DHCW motif cupin fold protein [Bosea sp. BH3]MCU4180702.1 DHCW motif cupin fold protein [Bosea sp. BH3]
MKISEIPFVTTDWSTVPPEHHAGDSGEATWRVQYFGPEENRIRVRMVEYSPGYVADHWCSKGHIILCLDGEMETTLADGRVMPLRAGMSYQVADGAEAHRSATKTGAKLFIVD